MHREIHPDRVAEVKAWFDAGARIHEGMPDYLVFDEGFYSLRFNTVKFRTSPVVGMIPAGESGAWADVTIELGYARWNATSALPIATIGPRRMRDGDALELGGFTPGSLPITLMGEGDRPLSRT